MAKYTSALAGWTPAAHADGAATIASSSYQAVRCTSASTISIVEVMIGGEATTSTVNRMSLRRLSTNGGTPTDVPPAKNNPLSAAAVHQGYSVASSGGTIASTAHLLNIAMNVFGGIYRWSVASWQDGFFAGTATAPNAEIVITSISGTGVVSTHMIAEEL